MKNVRRKYNPERNTMRLAPLILKRLNVCAVRLQSKVSNDHTKANTVIYNHKTVKRYASDPSIQKHLTDTPMKWSVWVGFIHRDISGNLYHKGEWIVAKDRYYFNELSDVMIDEINAVYESCNKKQVFDGAWIAIPYECELNDATIMAILQDYGEF